MCTWVGRFYLSCGSLLKHLVHFRTEKSQEHPRIKPEGMLFLAALFDSGRAAETQNRKNTFAGSALATPVLIGHVSETKNRKSTFSGNAHSQKL